MLTGIGRTLLFYFKVFIFFKGFSDLIKVLKCLKCVWVLQEPWDTCAKYKPFDTVVCLVIFFAKTQPFHLLAYMVFTTDYMFFWRASTISGIAPLAPLAVVEGRWFCRKWWVRSLAGTQFSYRWAWFFLSEMIFPSCNLFFFFLAWITCPLGRPSLMFDCWQWLNYNLMFVVGPQWQVVEAVQSLSQTHWK
jgi:hypothetical protein